MSEYSLKLNSSGANLKLELDLRNHVTKTNLKNVA